MEKLRDMHQEGPGGLPELLRFSDGTPVTTAEQWTKRRGEILALYEKYVYGRLPDSAQETVAYAMTGGRFPENCPE